MSDSHATKNHDYHLVNASPWPLTGSIGAFTMAVGAVILMRSRGTGEGLFGIQGPWVFVLGFLMVLGTMVLWWRDVIGEANGGDHTPVVRLHLRYGMIMFIASEVMFFVAWFWAYFNAALYPGDVAPLNPETTNAVIGMVQRALETGGVWPPKPMANHAFTSTFDPWGLPLVNTLILLLSGTTVTMAHHALLNNNRRGLIWGLAFTVVLGLMFTSLQAMEYSHAGFTYANNIYGATFFMATGFHGVHVIIGTIFLAVCLVRAMRGAFTPEQHFGFEAAAWYWHFVDVVWLFLFICIYVIGAGPHPGGAE